MRSRCGCAFMCKFKTTQSNKSPQLGFDPGARGDTTCCEVFPSNRRLVSDDGQEHGIGGVTSARDPAVAGVMSKGELKVKSGGQEMVVQDSEGDAPRGMVIQMND
eukprot:335982-Amphidinium_carterae.2